MMRSPQMMTSPWFPVVESALEHSVQSTISLGLPGADASTSRKPEYVPCTAVFPQKARSELNTPCPGTVLSMGTSFAENPRGCRFFVYVNVAVADAAPGGTAEAVSGTETPMATTTHASTSRNLCIETPFTTLTLLVCGGSGPTGRRPRCETRMFGQLPPIACLTGEVFSLFVPLVKREAAHRGGLSRSVGPVDGASRSRTPASAGSSAASAGTRSPPDRSAAR